MIEPQMPGGLAVKQSLSDSLVGLLNHYASVGAKIKAIRLTSLQVELLAFEAEVRGYCSLGSTDIIAMRSLRWMGYPIRLRP